MSVRIPRFSRSSLVWVIVLLTTCLVPSGAALAKTDARPRDVEVVTPASSDRAAVNDDPGKVSAEYVECGKQCCSECYSGNWYYSLMMCLQGTIGSCMHCETRCKVPEFTGDYSSPPQPSPIAPAPLDSCVGL